MQDNEFDSFPSNLKVIRKGDKVVLKARTVTMEFPVDRAPEIIQAIHEVSR